VAPLPTVISVNASRLFQTLPEMLLTYMPAVITGLYGHRDYGRSGTIELSQRFGDEWMNVSDNILFTTNGRNLLIWEVLDKRSLCTVVLSGVVFITYILMQLS